MNSWSWGAGGCPAGAAVAAAAGIPRHTRRTGPSPGSPRGDVDPIPQLSESRAARASRAVLAGDGGGFVLQPWQVAWLVATSEGREGVVPSGCGVGKGWLQARLDEALAEG